MVGSVVTTLLQHRDANKGSKRQRQAMLDDQQRTWIFALQDELLAASAARLCYSKQIDFDAETKQGFDPRSMPVMFTSNATTGIGCQR